MSRRPRDRYRRLSAPIPVVMLGLPAAPDGMGQHLAIADAFETRPENLVGVFVNGVQQIVGRDYELHADRVVFRRRLRPFRSVGTLGNLLTLFCATVLPDGDEVDAVIRTADGRKVVRLSPLPEPTNAPPDGGG